MTSAPCDVGYFADGGAIGMKPGDIVGIVKHGSTVGTSWFLNWSVINYVTTGGIAFQSTSSIITSS